MSTAEKLKAKFAENKFIEAEIFDIPILVKCISQKMWKKIINKELDGASDEKKAKFISEHILDPDDKIPAFSVEYILSDEVSHAQYDMMSATVMENNTGEVFKKK